MNFLRRRKPTDDSDDDDRSDNIGGSTVRKSRKPPNTAFRQQRLQAWQPILTPKSVIPILIVLAMIFAPLGIAILYSTYNVQLVALDYSQCETLANSDEFTNVPSKYVDYHFRNNNENPNFQWKLSQGGKYDSPQCVVHFTLPRAIEPPIFLYYKLTNFYQNHRKYVDSFDLNQLKGQAVPIGSLSSSCNPLRTEGEKIVYPCGLIANSLFNDTFTSPVLLNPQNGQNNETYRFSHKGISWPSDINSKFKNTTYTYDQIVPPPNWAKRFPQGYNETNVPDLARWEHLQNWMRTSGLPSFYKLYGKNTTASISSGTYEMTITLNYPTTIFGGTKSMVITTSSIFGGRNVSLGVVYIIVAIVCLVLGIGFLLQHLIKPRRIGDHNFLQGQMGTTFRDQL